MRLKVNQELSDLLGQVHACLEEDESLYLVGGAVRDLLMGHPLHDLDFVMQEVPTGLVKRIARHLGADFFMLDDERHTARIMYINPEGDLFPLDFIQFTGSGLEEDLRNRDFTINAMAIPINDLSTIVDPLNGQRSLEDAHLRACTTASLLDDPVRALRAVRLAIQLGFRMDAGLGELIRQAVPFLGRTSVERQRDELFKILEGPDPALGMVYLYEYGMIESLLPSLAEGTLPSDSQRKPPVPFEHKIPVLKTFDRLLRVLSNPDLPGEALSMRMKEAVTGLLPFREEIAADMAKEITPGRKKRSLALLGIILRGSDSETAWNAARHLELSNAEAAWICRMVDYGGNLRDLAAQGEAPGRRSIYQFFKAADDAGVAIVLFIMAESAGVCGENLSGLEWTCVLRTAAAMLRAWFQDRDVVISPTLFLDGNDLQQVFGLKPGRRIGKMLAALEEAQASGEVRTKEAAEDFVREKFSIN